MKHSLRSVSSLFVLLAAMLGTDTHAQHKARHITIPDGKPDTIEIGPMSSMVKLENANVWLHNPTSDTLVYWSDFGSSSAGDFYVSLPRVVAPHDSGRIVVLIDPGTVGMANVKIRKSDDPLAYYVDEPIVGLSEWRSTEEANTVQVFDDQFVYHGLLRYDDPWDYTPIDSMIYLNDQDSLVTIQTIFIPKGSHFTISGFSKGLPVVLGPGEKLTAYFAYGEPDTVGFIDTSIQDTIYWDLAVVVTDTTYPVSSARFHNIPAKSSPALSAHQAPEADHVRCYPNPATDEITIACDSPLGQRPIEIIDAAGRVVRRLRCEQISIEKSVNISLASLPAGTYLVHAGGAVVPFIKR